MNDNELEKLIAQSKLPFICENTNCDCYRTRPICETHAHAKCELYPVYFNERQKLDAIRDYDGWGMYGS